MSRSIGVLAVLLLSLLLPGRALAVPGDPVPAPISPADGATVAAAPTLVFTCPTYRQSPSLEPGTGNPGPGGYGVQVAADPSFTKVIGAASADAGPAEGQCSAQPSVEGRPISAPGTYYWRVSRSCFCADGTEEESGPVASFTVGAPSASLTAVVPKRVYRGYTVAVELRTDLPEGQRVVLERDDGGGWTPVRPAVPVEVRKGRATAPVDAGRRSFQVRWTVVRGTAVDRSAPVRVRPVRARRWSTARSGGAYRATGKTDVTFRVARGGRELRGFRARLGAYCVVGQDVSDNYVRSSVALVRRIRVAPDGGFYAVVRISKTDIVVRGLLRGGTVTGGYVSIAYSACSGGLDFTAKRR